MQDFIPLPSKISLKIQRSIWPPTYSSQFLHHIWERFLWKFKRKLRLYLRNGKPSPIQQKWTFILIKQWWRSNTSFSCSLELGGTSSHLVHLGYSDYYLIKIKVATYFSNFPKNSIWSILLSNGSQRKLNFKLFGSVWLSPRVFHQYLQDF